MDTTLYVTLSHQMAMRRQMDLIANNMANMNTTAYRREAAIFQEYLTKMTGTETPETREVAFVQDYGVARDTRQGQLVATDNVFDVAIEGDGLFAVRRDGAQQIHYTRNGHFMLSSDGFLALESGEKLLDADNNPIAISNEDTDIQIAEDGTITSKKGVLGQLSLVQFPATAVLERIGGGLFTSPAQPRPAEGITIKHRMLEQSNVNPLQEMTDMINVMRSYQSVARLVDQYQQMRSRGIEQLGRVQ